MKRQINMLEHVLVAKPLRTPDRVRGRLLAGHALVRDMHMQAQLAVPLCHAILDLLLTLAEPDAGGKYHGV